MSKDAKFYCDKCNITFEDIERNEYMYAHCKCGKQVKRIDLCGCPMISFNHWKPDYRQNDGEKEFIAAGGYE